MWKLWKSASSPYAASKTAQENLWEKRLFSTVQFTLLTASWAQQIPFRFSQGHFLPKRRENRSTNTMNIHAFNLLFHSFHTMRKTFCGKPNCCYKRFCGFLPHFVHTFLHKTGDLW